MTNPPASARPAPRPVPVKMPPWGWVEWFAVIQTSIQFLLFVPGVGAFRVLARIAAFAVALVAWFWVLRSGRRPPRGARPFPATPWLVACAVWLGLSIFHPTTNSLFAGIAAAAMYLTVMSPVFWAPAEMASSKQIGRLMKIVFGSCIIGTAFGIGQVYRPNTFNPPYIPAIDDGNEYSRGSLTYTAANGQTIIRPCGLSDNPGGAAGSAAMACLIGLSLAVMPLALWKRVFCLGVAFAGMAVIYFCQMRATMVMEFICIGGLIVLFALRGNLRQATLLGVGSLVLLVGSAAWVVTAVGEVGTKRFFSLIEERPDQLYMGARGSSVQETFERLIWEYPLGAGLGRWGQANTYFGDPSLGYDTPAGKLWVEVQWPGWVIDGGIPLLVCYAIAMGLAVADSLRIALTCKDRELSYWAAVIFTTNLSVVAATFGQCPFVAQSGLSFWLGAAALHAASQLDRVKTAGRSPLARRAAAA